MFARRIRTLGIVAAVLFFGLAVRLFELQIVSGDLARKKALDAAVDEVPVEPWPGAIVDRNGVVLARSVPAYALDVFPARFRDGNLTDALLDAAHVVVPDAASVAAAGAAARGPGAWARWRNAARAGLRAVADDFLGNPASRGLVPDAGVRRRLRARMGAKGGLFVPEESLERRFSDALVRLSRPSLGLDWKALRARLGAGGTLGDALGATPEELLGRIAEEEDRISRLAALAGFAGADDLLAKVEDLLLRESEYVDEIVESRIEDQIVLDEFGSRDLGPDEVGGRRFAAIATRAALPLERAQDLAGALFVANRWLSASGDLASPGRDAAVKSRFQGDLAAASAPERRNLARTAGLFGAAPEDVKRAYARSVRKAAGFHRADFLSPPKEVKIRNERRGDRPFEVTRGRGFDLACFVEGPSDLREIGFRVRTGWKRAYPCGDVGSVTDLLGVVTSMGIAPDGLERRLAEDPGEAGRRFRGTPGLLRRERRGSGRAPKEEVAAPVLDGETVTLAIDVDLTRRLSAVLAERGAVAVLDVATGDALALVTHPATDPEGWLRDFRSFLDLETAIEEARHYRKEGGTDGVEVERLVLDARRRLAESPRIHRAVEGVNQMPPGSVMKTIVAAAALEDGKLDPNEVFHCVARPGHRFNDGKHGDVHLEEALAKSCNETFWQVGMRLGTPRLAEWFDRFGLYSDVPFLPGGGPARLKRLLEMPDDPRNLAIGQGSHSVPPIQMAAGVAVFGNKGRLVRPRLVRSIGSYEPEPAGPGASIVSETTAATVLEGMREVVKSGTAHKVTALKDLMVAGKTGTPQVTTEKRAQENNCAWFAGVAPHDRPRFAFAVMIERTDESGRAAAEIAASVVSACYDVLGREPADLREGARR